MELCGVMQSFFKYAQNFIGYVLKFSRQWVTVPKTRKYWEYRYML